MPATYLIKPESFKIMRDNGQEKPRSNVIATTGGPQIVKSLMEVSDLLKVCFIFSPLVVSLI